MSAPAGERRLLCTVVQPQLLAGDHVARLRPPDSPIVWVDNPEVDEWGAVTVGHYGGWAVQILSMIYNDRVVLTSHPSGYEYGWCFDKGGAAHLAVLVWNPDLEGEPLGFKKAAAMYLGRPRQPGEHAPARGWLR